MWLGKLLKRVFVPKKDLVRAEAFYAHDEEKFGIYLEYFKKGYVIAEQSEITWKNMDRFWKEVLYGDPGLRFIEKESPPNPKNLGFTMGVLISLLDNHPEVIFFKAVDFINIYQKHLKRIKGFNKEELRQRIARINPLHLGHIGLEDFEKETENASKQYILNTMQNEIEIRDVIDDLHKASVALKNRDALLLKTLSNHTIDEATIHQDEASINVAVLIYSLAKIVERFQGQETEKQAMMLDRIQNRLDRAVHLLEEGKIKGYVQVIRQVFEKIGEIDEKFTSYVQEVIDKAKINKGSKMVERGISIGRSAEMMGMLQYDLMSYVGKTLTSDAEDPKVSTRDRLRFAGSLFGVSWKK